MDLGCTLSSNDGEDRRCCGVEEMASRQAPLVNHEGPVIGATIDAVKSRQILADSVNGC